MNINDCPCPQLLKDFLFYMLTIKGRSQRTVDAYYIDLRLFLRYLRASREHFVHAGAKPCGYFHRGPSSGDHP